MIKKIMLASCLLVASMASQAALISYNGYERDTTKNYVTGGGLEWLMWDVTNGMSINSALSLYSSQGWRLASNDQIAALFNKFEFGKNDWDNRETSEQTSIVAWNAAEWAGAHYHFINLFGATHSSSCTDRYCYAGSDPWITSLAFYGSDADMDSKIQRAQVLDDATFFGRFSASYENHVAVLTADVSTGAGATNHGVALVRATSTPPSVVPTPGSIGLLALGLVALSVRRRHGLGR